MRNLILVLGLAILCAFGVAAFFVMNFGPSGVYQTSNTLLNPSLLNELDYNDINPRTSAMDRFIFDRIEFKWLNESQNKWLSREIDLAGYEKLYNMISKDASLLKPESAMGLFNQASKIIIYVKTESSAEWQKVEKIFQTLEFSNEGNFYRIELHEQNKGDNWVYFKHPGIYQTTLQLESK